MTVFLLSDLYNEKFHLYYYDEDKYPDEVLFIPFNEELSSDPLRILYHKEKYYYMVNED